MVSNGSKHINRLHIENVSPRYALTIIYETRSNSVSARHTCVQNNLHVIMKIPWIINSFVLGPVKYGVSEFKWMLFHIVGVCFAPVKLVLLSKNWSKEIGHSTS